MEYVIPYKSYVFICMSTLLPAFSLCQIREVHSMDDYGNKYQKVFFEDCDLIYFEREYKVKDGFWNRYVILKQEGNWYQGDDNFQNIAFKTQSRGVHMYRKNDSRWRVRQIAGETNGIKWVKIRLQMDDGLEEVVKDGLTGWTINVSKANAVVDGHAQAELLPYRISKQLSYALEIFYQNNF